MEEEKTLEPIIFTHEEFGEIRTFWIDGKPYFIGKEIATKLGYKDTVNALKDHVKDKHKLGWQIATSGQRRNMTLISEAGLYTLILKSTLPAAEKFQDWVTEEVLPTLRKTGSYSMPGSEKERFIFVNLGGNNFMSEDLSNKWLNEKIGENLIKIAKLVDSTERKKWLLDESVSYLTGKSRTF